MGKEGSEYTQNLFQYPLSFDALLRNRKKIKKELLSKDGLIEKRIAILGGSTTNELKNLLDLILLTRGIKGVFYESEYNMYYEEIMFSNQKLTEFKPQLIYLFSSVVNLRYFPLNSNDNMAELLESEFSKYKSLWDKVRQEFNCPIIQNNFDPPKYRPNGNLDSYSMNGNCLFINKLNIKFAEEAQSREDLYLCDINWLAYKIGSEKWHDFSKWYSYKYAVGIEAMPYLANNVASIISTIYGKSSKCLVLDLDNTIWGGVIGDDGVEGLEIGVETPLGEAYRELQSYILMLKKRGVLLAIASKNDREKAIEGIEHPENLIKLKDLTNIQSNWERKDLNILKIAKLLNISTDSLVFLDDNPTEREIVMSSLPEVSVPNLGDDVLTFLSTLDMSGLFEPISISKEDLARNEMYKANAMRAESENSITNYSDFLISLNMNAEIHQFKKPYFDRIAQLTNKTNQFNLTTKRCTINEIIEISQDKNNYITLQGKLKDKFGDNGVVALISAKVERNSAYIELLLMSCRVIKRGMEDAMLNVLFQKASDLGIEKIYGSYIETKKNNMVKDFYKDRGFLKCHNNINCEGASWMIDVACYTPKQHFIRVENCE